MKPFATAIAAVLAWTSLIFPVAAHAYVSDGSDGAFLPTASIVLDATQTVYNFSDFEIPLGVSVSFSGVALTQPILLLATGNINIAGMIDGGGNSLWIETPRDFVLSGTLANFANLTLTASSATLTASSIIDVTGVGNSACVSVDGNCRDLPTLVDRIPPLDGGALTLSNDGDIQLAVPEPQTWAMLGVGLLVVSTASRARRKQPAAAR
jgi:hypothetical protein